MPVVHKKKFVIVRRRTLRSPAFSLIELLVAVAICAVGMVFILGAFSQCVSSRNTAENMIDANYLLNKKMWELNLAYETENGTIEGESSGVFDEPYDNFSWADIISKVKADFGNQSSFVQEILNEDTFTVFWSQGRIVKDISVVRYVKKKPEAQP